VQNTKARNIRRKKQKKSWPIGRNSVVRAHPSMAGQEQRPSSRPVHVERKDFGCGRRSIASWLTMVDGGSPSLSTKTLGGAARSSGAIRSRVTGIDLETAMEEEKTAGGEKAREMGDGRLGGCHMGQR
jgi:hypothetical protein